MVNRREREFAQTLRQQQDQAYEESLRVDREKERRRQQEREQQIQRELEVVAQLEAERERKEVIFLKSHELLIHIMINQISYAKMFF